MTKLFDKKHVLLKLSACIANYTSESVVERMRPNPDQTKFISPSELSSLAKDGVGGCVLWLGIIRMQKR